MLPTIGMFATVALRELVYYLIAHHNDTNHQYPSSRSGGDVRPVELGVHAGAVAQFEESLSEPERRRAAFLLSQLQEADALAATDKVGAERTSITPSHGGVPIFEYQQPNRRLVLG